MKIVWIGFALSAAAALGQTFDVATIKPSPPHNGGMHRVGCSGGPGTKDPTLLTCENYNLSNLICSAYEISYYQLGGADLGNDQQFNITARIPEGATKEQFHAMLRNLLADRFKLTTHQEQKDVQVYDLVIAKNGPKLKESAAAVPPATPSGPPGGGPPKTDKDGYPILSGGTSMTMMNGRARAHWDQLTMNKLAGMLSSQVGKPVTDVTGLAGKYNVDLSWAAGGVRSSLSAEPLSADADSGPDIFAALQEQLGLKLESKKGSVQSLVVDHVEKMPSEN